MSSEKVFRYKPQGVAVDSETFCAVTNCLRLPNTLSQEPRKMLAHHESIIVEIWVEYVLGLFVMAMGLVARWKIGGAHLSWDDLFAAISIVLWTIDPALEQYIATKGTFVGVDASTAQNLSTAETSLLEKGSKALFAAWFIYVTLIWTLKGTVLGYYYRLT
ncbi:hypothetical protein BC567DRAFT_239822 [Phyllosticta citribraziliensis]